MAVILRINPLVTVNGEPYVHAEDVPDGDTTCTCRRCLLHDDPGGCVAELAFWDARRRRWVNA